MEWSNAKKFVIVLLVLLNVLLAGLNYNQNRENTMTATQERSIFEVLSRNGITMYTDLLTEHERCARCLGNESSEKRQGRDDQDRSSQRSAEIH